MNPSDCSPERVQLLRGLEDYLRNRILGQDHVWPYIVPLLHRGELGLSTPGRPRGSFLFLGPTGVGKTETVVEMTDYLFGRDHLFRFDMSEYQTQESLRVLIGGTIDEIGTIGTRLRGIPHGTILFDECEKAHPRVLDLLLQILDAARITMATGECLDLANFYVVLTSNLGSMEILELQRSTFSTMERHVLGKAQQALRPELYARITEKIVFNRLDFDTQVQIARLRLSRELEFLRTKGIEVQADESVLPFIVQRGFSAKLGARPLRDAIERSVRSAVTDRQLSGNPVAGYLTAHGTELVLSHGSVGLAAS